MLQSMRIRDIGWDPVCVIPAWIAIPIVDKLMAAKFPGLGGRAGRSTGPSVGTLINSASFWL